jgi:hypothetical protein
MLTLIQRPDCEAYYHKGVLVTQTGEELFDTISENCDPYITIMDNTYSEDFPIFLEDLDSYDFLAEGIINHG